MPVLHSTTRLRGWIRIVLGLLALLPAHAGLIRIDVENRRDVLAGRAFGDAGPYESIRGRAWFAVDPTHRLNRNIVDIKQAPRNSKGLVEYSADVYILKPRDPGKGNGTILFEAPNRGGKGMLGMFNRAAGSLDPSLESHFGDGLLLNEGYTLLWVGWQHDVPRNPGLMRLHAPVAKGTRGLVRSEFTADSPLSRLPLGDSGHVPYEPADLQSFRITERQGIHGSRRMLERSEWKLENGSVVLQTPAKPGYIYEFIYEATDPAIAGLGLVAMRDLVSFLKYGGNGAGVLGDQRPFLKHAIGFGVSQSAMALRALLYEGFNEDESGNRVFDGILAHVAGGRRSTFQRFAQPSRTAGPMRNASLSPTDQFPYSDTEQIELQTKVRGSLVARAVKATPKIFHTNSSYEYWGSAGSLIHTTLDGQDDLPLPSSTRIYMFAGGQHGPAAFPPAPGRAQNPANFNDYKWSLRSLLGRLRAWVVNGQEPPPSRYPKVRDRTLVSVKDYSFPAISQTNPPDHAHRAHHLDFGPEYGKHGIIREEPPAPGVEYGTRVPQCDRDGNDLSGVRMPAVAVPLGTFTGWNLRALGIGAPSELLGNTGSYIAFPRTKADRVAKSDPRLSIEERYRDRADYLTRVQQNAASLAREGFLLERDVPSLVDFAGKHWDWLHR